MKQRLHRASSPVATTPGTRLYADGEQSVGEVVSAAPHGEGFALLLALRGEAARGALKLGAADGAALSGVTPL